MAIIQHVFFNTLISTTILSINNPSGAPEFTPVFSRVRAIKYLFTRSLFVL